MGLPRVRLLARLKALEEALEHARDESALEPRWRRELEALRAELAPHEPLPRYGVDYAWGRPTTAGLHAHGVGFVGRYLTGEGKALTRPEASELSRAGISIVSYFEQEALAMSRGRMEGEADGREALQAAQLVRMPHGRPIYFACDYEATDVTPVINYLAGAQSSLGSKYLAGVYGSFRVVSAALAHGTRFAVQTVAWSGGAWQRRAQVRQTDTSGPIIDGVGCDTLWAYAQDFGGWRL